MKRKTKTVSPLAAAAFAAVAIGCSSSSSSSGGVMAFSPSTGTTSLLPTAGHHHLVRHHGGVVSPGTNSLFPSAGTSGRASTSDAWNAEDVSTFQRKTSALSMSAAPVVTAGAGALAGCLSGGLFAGGLHAIAGPDHLAALLPRCCGQRWYRAGRIGALWGMGHGVSATIIGVLAFALKNRVSKVGRLSSVLNSASSFMELAVGLSLIFIGFLGFSRMKEAREWSDEIEGAGETPSQSLSAAAADDGVKMAQKRAVIFNGVLHGFSWDGAPSLAPAVAVATWTGNITFLLSYALGTMSAMAITTTIIGEGTRRAGELLHRPDIPQELSYFSSIIALVVGAVWCGLALNKKLIFDECKNIFLPSKI